jgi:hypothetical protein
MYSAPKSIDHHSDVFTMWYDAEKLVFTIRRHASIAFFPRVNPAIYDSYMNMFDDVCVST